MASVLRRDPRLHNYKVWRTYIYVHTNADWLHCMISSLGLRRSAITVSCPDPTSIFNRCVQSRHVTLTYPSHLMGHFLVKMKIYLSICLSIYHLSTNTVSFSLTTALTIVSLSLGNLETGVCHIALDWVTISQCVRCYKHSIWQTHTAISKTLLHGNSN